MYRSTKTSLKFANREKSKILDRFIDNYRDLVSQFIDMLWNEEKVPQLLGPEYTSKIQSPIKRAQIIQCAGKQASGIVRGTKSKIKRRQFVIDKLVKENKLVEARKLQKIQDEAVVSKPNIDMIEPELDSRFVSVDLDNSTSFDGWLTLLLSGRGEEKIELKIPFKKTKHFNKLLVSGQLKSGVRLSKKSATFMFEIPEVKRESGGTVGIDIGLKDTFSASSGQVISADNHGHTFQSICDKLSRKKKGSKGFKRAQEHRSNYLHWCVNQLNLENVSVLQRENIKHLRKFKRQKRNMQAFNYADLFRILDGKAETLGVQVVKLNPCCTSQRCSKCGYVSAENRKSKRFECMHCGFAADADFNASVNLSKNLTVLERSQSSKKAFFWMEKPDLVSKETIIPCTEETDFIDFQWNK